MSCCNDTKQIILGERRRITLDVWLNDGSSFTADNPTWSLSARGLVESSGSCESYQEDKHWKLTAEVQPKSKGRYTLCYTFGLGSEIIKRNVTLEVIA